MKKQFVVIIFLFTLYGCELIDISKRETIQRISLTQETPIGAVYLFMAEVDSTNPKGASVLLAEKDGKHYLAEDKVEMYEDLQRLNRIIRFSPITNFHSDTLSNSSIKVCMVIDYFKTYSFLTEKINNNWYIVDYSKTN